MSTMAQVGGIIKSLKIIYCSCATVQYALNEMFLKCLIEIYQLLERIVKTGHNVINNKQYYFSKER